jgi:hypothetical protein
MSFKPTKSYITCLKLFDNLADRTKKKKVKQNTYSEGIYEQIELDEEEDYFPENFTILESSIFQDLTTRAQKLVHKISAEIKANNALWYFDHTKNSRDSAAISELKRRKVLFDTETTTIHLVNPAFIRKGHPGSTLGLTMGILKKSSKVTRDMIKAMRIKGKIQASMYDLFGAE